MQFARSTLPRNTFVGTQKTYNTNYKNINLISKIGGITLLVTGILILTNQLQAIGFYIIKVFPFMQNFG